jgi:hypothetical protein
MRALYEVIENICDIIGIFRTIIVRTEKREIDAICSAKPI